MNDDLIRQRIRDLEDNLRQDLKLLKDFEDAIRLEDDPRRKARYRQDIERQRESLDRNQNEYDDLESQIAAADRLKISDLLLQKDTKLANLQKLLPPIWNVPFSQNPNFTGREQTLAELYSVLLSNQPVAWKEALWGMGGALAKLKSPLSMPIVIRPNMKSSGGCDPRSQPLFHLTMQLWRQIWIWRKRASKSSLKS